MKTSTEKNKKIVTTAVLAVIIIILQFLGYIIKTGSISISLVLVPVVIGAAMYGPSVGAFLGGVFGAVTAVACVIGLDVGGALLLTARPVVTVILCLAKGILAGFVSGLLFKLISKKNGIVGTVVAAAACPIVNTGIFCAGMAIFYGETLQAWANGTDVLVYVFTGLIGINFIIEFLINIIICPIIARSLKIGA